MAESMTAADIGAMEGTDLGWSDWFTIGQERIDAFADATLDHQYIHVDPERAARTPFESTIAHGFLTVSLMVHLIEQIAPRPANQVMGINYGFDRLRFLSPVKVGSAIRLGAKIDSVTDRGEGRLLLAYDVTVEIEGEERPALVATWLSMVVLDV